MTRKLFPHPSFPVCLAFLFACLHLSDVCGSLQPVSVEKKFFGPPHSSATTRQTSVPTDDFISTATLILLKAEVENGLERLGESSFITDVDINFSNEVDVMYRIRKGIETADPVLEDGLSNDRLINQDITTFRSAHVTQPFTQAVPKSSQSLRAFVAEATNGTSRPGDFFYWMSGKIQDFNLTQNSRLVTLSMTCKTIAIIDFKTDEMLDSFSWYTFTRGAYIYPLFMIPVEHVSALCGGDDLFFTEHGENSQRFWLSDTDYGKPQWVGNFTGEDTNAGGESYEVKSEDGETSPYFHELQKTSNGYYGTQGLGVVRSIWLEAEAEFENSLSSYNNFAFLLLSLTALVSSTIIAVVTSRKAGKGELAVVLVEGIVVMLFFGVLTHALVAFSRPEDYVVDYQVNQKGVHFHDDILVRSRFVRRISAFGKRLDRPNYLIAAVVLAALACLIVIGNVGRLFWNRKTGKYNGIKLSNPPAAGASTGAGANASNSSIP